MKTLIIYVSIHKNNTEKIAKVISKVLNARLVKPNNVKINELPKYDLIGFGSGIYFGKHHRSLLNLADRLPILKDKKVFIFSTSGMSNKLNFFHNLCHRTTHFHNPLKEKLLKKGFNIIGEVSCKGLDIVGPFKFIGGINKGRPNKNDLKNAKNFARNLKNKFTKLRK